MLDRLCKDNVICCDDNCKRCANLIYEKYMEQKAEIKRLQEEINQMSDACEMCGREYTEDVFGVLKEFMKRFKKEIETTPNMNAHFRFALLRYAEQISDNLVKEMTEESK